MATRNKGSHVKRKKYSPTFWIIVTVAFLSVLFFGAGFFSFINWSRRVSPPVFEEIFSTGAEFHGKLKKIDRAIYESLYLKGVAERDVFFLDVRPEHRDGCVWDFTEILIKCPARAEAYQLHQTLTAQLSRLGPEVRFTKLEERDGSLTCFVSFKAFCTHKICLVFGLPPARFEGGRPRVAILIDDLGYDKEIASSFITSGLPLSFSVLPSAPFAAEIVRAALRQDSELIVHLPMEPKNYPAFQPGPQSLLLRMNKAEILRVLHQNLVKIPGARGVNNHMGSAFTESREKMLVVLRELKKRGLFYVDSRTTGDTVGFDLAREIGLPVAMRNVFLDNDLENGVLKFQLERLFNMARHSGAAIGIGHPHENTIRILKECYPKIKDEFELVPVSKVLS